MHKDVTLQDLNIAVPFLRGLTCRLHFTVKSPDLSLIVRASCFLILGR